MAFFGLFGNYSKPGPGVSKDEEERSSFADFFVTYKRHLGKLTKLNLTFLIPFLFAFVLMFFLLITPITRIALYGMDLWVLYAVPFPLVLLAPFWGGMLVVARRIAKQEYVFVWSEYWKGVADNWKQFLGSAFINYIFYIIASFSAIYYINQVKDNAFYYVPFALVMIVSIIFLMMQCYIGLLIVSIELKMKAIYKNAFLLSVLGLPRNIIFGLVFAVFAIYFNFCVMIWLTFLIALALVFFFAFSAIAYSNSAINYPVIKRFIEDANKRTNAKPIEKEATEDDDEMIFEDIL